MTEARHRLLRRVHLLTGALPVAMFLAGHFAANAAAIAGPGAFNRLAARLDAVPFLGALELAAIAAPIAVHVVLGILLANTGRAIESADRYPRPWMITAQRASGGFLVVYLAFHVWGTRLSPEVLAGGADLFAVMSRRLEHPGVLALHVLGVLAACLHLTLGLAAVRAYWHPGAPAPAGRRVPRLPIVAGAALALVGLNALLAFVARPARWLEP